MGAGSDHRLEIVLAARDISAKAFKAFQGRISVLTKHVFSFQGALIGLAGGAGMGALIKQSFNVNDSLAKTADKLGLTTEALAGLRHASELTGAGSRTLDMGLQRMTRRIAEAAQGTGEARNALKELGLDARALAGMSPDQAFQAIAEAMSRVQTQSDRVRLAFKLFDSEGVALVNTLALGSKGLRNAADEADALGLAISRVDAARIEEANDAIHRMNSAVKGVSTTVAINLAPHLTEASNQFTGWVKSNESLIKQKVPEYINKIKSSVSGIWDFISGHPEILEFGLIGMAVWGRKGMAVGAVGGVIADYVNKTFGGAKDAIEELENRAAQLRLNMATGRVNLESLESAVGPPDTEGIQIAKDRLQEYREELIGIERTLTFIEEKAKLASLVPKVPKPPTGTGSDAGGGPLPAALTGAGMDAETRQWLGEYQSTVGVKWAEMARKSAQLSAKSAKEAFAREMRDSRTIVDPLGDVWKNQIWNGENGLTEATTKITKAMEGWVGGANKAFSRYSKTASDAAANTEMLFTNAFQNAENALVSFTTTGKLEFSSFANSVLADLTRMAYRQKLLGPISTWLGGLDLSQLWGKIFPSAKGNAIPGAGIAAYENQIIKQPTVFPFARGAGIPNIGLVGEAGWEAIMPLTRMSGGDLGVKVDIDRLQSGAAYARTGRPAYAEPESQAPKTISQPVVNFIIKNETGQPVQARQESIHYDAGEMILTVVLDAVVVNRGNFGSNLRGALSLV